MQSRLKRTKIDFLIQKEKALRLKIVIGDYEFDHDLFYAL